MDDPTMTANLVEILKGSTSTNPEPEPETETSLTAGLTEMLRSGNLSTGNDVIFRRGTADDVFQEEPPAEKKYWEPESDGNT
jgi:hypothetical protein